MTTVKKLRLAKKYAPRVMANLLGIKDSTYFDKEAGRRKFKPHEIVIICKHFKQRVENIEDFCIHKTKEKPAT